MRSSNIHFRIFQAYVNAAAVFRLAILCILLSSTGITAAASDLQEDGLTRRFAASSALASGKWAKVKVEQSGLQFISTSTLRQLGFQDPAKVNVYGFGGRLIPETLSADDPDDLPVLPVLRSADGIRFFGFNHIRWDYSEGKANSLTFTHQMQPYAEESWYFLSDKPTEEYAFPSLPQAGGADALPIVDTFSQMLLHEQDLMCPATSGRVTLGEDFRSPAQRSFSFNLTDQAPGDAFLRVNFAASTSASSSFSISANGVQLPSSNNDTFSGITNSDQYFYLNSSKKKISNPSSNLKIDITFRNNGSIKLANLDFIEIEYPRHIRLHDGQIYFNTNLTGPACVKITGAGKSTILWDLTDPVRPCRVELKIEGSSATFTGERGVRHYIAFNPDAKGYAITAGEAVGNQDIHSVSSPEMLIISPAEYKSAADRLATHHKDFDKLNVLVLTPEEIYNEFSSGTPDPSAFRKLMKMWRFREPEILKYCLILSRPTYDHKNLSEITRQAGYPRVPIWQSPTGFSKNTSYSTDDFIGMLEDCPNAFSIASAKINVSVGRMPVTSLSEANLLVDKYINYTTKADFGNWRNHIMLIADDQDSGIHFTQTETFHNEISTIGRGGNYLYEKLYLDTYPLESGATGHVYPAAKKRMKQLWGNDGIAMISYIGHASTVGWTHEDLLNWLDIKSFSNKRLPFLYAATCEFARYDDDNRSGAEVLWSNPSGGIIATICPARTVYMSPNGVLSKNIARTFFKTSSSEGGGKRIGDIYREAKNNITTSDDNKLKFALIGNPAMRFPVPEREVLLQSIDGIPVEADLDPNGFPILEARSKVKLSGTVVNHDGSVDENFSGTLDILLYDALTGYDSLGNGEDGIVISYNDRKTLLYHGLVSVTAGKWEADINIPAEINNNYAPARLVFYAYSNTSSEASPSAREAHGAAECFYVYGYKADADSDSSGPEISLFSLNRQGFENGDVIGTSAMVLADFSDPSGINLSDAGIGHKITLVLDGKKYFEDVNSYFSPTLNDATSGSLRYPLSDLPAGKHNLQLKVWDNAGNSSAAMLEFEVAANLPPQIYELSTDVNPAKSHVNFILSTSDPLAKTDTTIEVFDLNGCRVWKSETQASADIATGLQVGWDLCDGNGVRVPRGIYIYRATLTSESGSTATKAQKLAVTAP